MTEFQAYNNRIRDWEATRQRLVAEEMQKPFGLRVMSDSAESELQEIEDLLINTPPILGSHEGQAVFAGKGLLPERDDCGIEGLLTCDSAGIEVIPRDQWPAYIEGQGGEAQLHIEPYVPFTFNQGSVGSCAAEGGVGCLSAGRVKSGQPHVLLNPYFVYNTTSGGRDQGSTLSDTVNFLRNQGCASEAVWGRVNGWQRMPSQAAREDALQYRQTKVVKLQNWDEFGTMLLNGYPVYFGYSGHAIFGSRLIAMNRFRYKNSWGNWGDNGYGTLSESAIMWSYGVYVFLSVCERE